MDADGSLSFQSDHDWLPSRYIHHQQPPALEHGASGNAFQTESDRFPSLSSPPFEADMATMTALERARSNSRSTRSSQLPEPRFEGRPLDSPLTHVPSNSPPQFHAQVSNAIPEESWHYYTAPHADDEQAHEQFNPTGSWSQSYPTRNTSVASKNTYQQGLTLFGDFDGVHYSSRAESFVETIGPTQDADEELLEEHEDNEDNERKHQKVVDATALEKLTSAWPRQQQQQWAEPPPAENMVYYPAPVPRNINLPKRLSKQPDLNLAAQRRSEVLDSLKPDSRQSVSWLAGLITEIGQDEGKPQEYTRVRARERQSRQNLVAKNRVLPPQLRASVFFDHEPVAHEVQIKEQSAVATLESLLDASAEAPAGVPAPFPQRTFGESDSSRTEKAIRNTISQLDGVKDELRKSRASIMGMKKSGMDLLSRVNVRNKSAMSLYGNPLNRYLEELDEKDEEGIDESTPMNRSEADESEGHDRYAFGEREEDYEDYEEEELAEELKEDDSGAEEGEQQYVPPATLLAELQLRKQRLRSRNRTAATAFPNGMHSTLLELDAVAQVEKKNRRGLRTALAWEDPAVNAEIERAADDDEVPLGMLFAKQTAGQRGPSDWDRPLGLLEKRTLEESEPLSQRRNRLKGVNPNKPTDAPGILIPTTTAVEEARAAEDSEQEGETLAQRTRRLKTRKALDDAIGGASGKEADRNATFSSELLSQFGGVVEEQNVETTDPPPRSEEEETLGQRRRRLQAEAQARDVPQGSPERGAQPIPPSKPTQSLANLLSSNPIAGTWANNAQAVAGPTTAQGLLGLSEQERAARERILYQQKLLGSMFSPGTPLVDTQQQTPEQLRGQLKAVEDFQQLRHHKLATGSSGPYIETEMAPEQLRGQLKAAQASHDQRQRDLTSGNYGPYFGPDPAPVEQFRGQMQQANQNKDFPSAIFNDGSGGLDTFRATKAGTRNAQYGNVLAKDILQTGPAHGAGTLRQAGLPPLQNGVAMGAYQQPVYPAPMMHTAYNASVPATQFQTPAQPVAYNINDPNALPLSSQQRDTIDRWRQGVL